MKRESQLRQAGVGRSKSLYLDEIALKKGQGQFETVISTDTRVLSLVQGKASQTLQAFLKSVPGIEQIEAVAMDMCASFAHAVKQVLPKAQIVTDRFHLIRHLNDTLDKARKRTHPGLDKKQRKRFSQIHFLLGRQYASLHRDEKRLIQDYLRLNPALKPLYGLTQQFRQILFHAWQSREKAYQALWDWCETARRYLNSFVRLVERWWTPVLNACLSPLSNGRQEGINHKIKLVKRQGYGFRNRELFRLKVLAAFNP